MNKSGLKKKILYLKYRKKAEKLNVSYSLLEVIVERFDNEYCKNILNIMDNSKNIDDFKLKIINMLKDKKSNILYEMLLVGNILNKYDFYHFSYNEVPGYINLDNFNYSNEDNNKILEILKNNFYEYVINDNRIKNLFLVREDGKYDYTIDLSKEKVNKYFDELLSGNCSKDINIKLIYSEICNYIINIIGVYDMKDIFDNFEFIKFDMSIDNKEKSLNERRELYFKKNSLSLEQISLIDNIFKLKSRLQSINNEDSLVLLKRLDKIESNLYDKIDELEDIYREYEILFREDIISHLYVPLENETVITDFKDLMPQLLHVFYRNTEKFRNALEKNILDDILSRRKDNNKSCELSDSEKLEYEKRLHGVDASLEGALVNYSFYDRNGFYSDRDGFVWYHSDTSNQISASLYSEEYFIFNPFKCFIGIGFNSDTLIPEAIALSSVAYLTTNKGLNNLEYDEAYEFEFTKSSYEDLKNNDGKSEVVLFRRNIDFDTRASYVFVSYDSENKKSIELLEIARQIANKNNLKLVVYDLRKIYDSYHKNEQLSNKTNRKR